MTRREQFVKLLSPGTLFDETTELPIAAWDIGEAMRLAARITERHNSKPYGFTFSTKIVSDGVPDGEGGTLKVSPKTVKESGTHFINGTLRTYDDVVNAGRADESILRSNMHCNEVWIVCETANGWRHVGEFKPDSLTVNADGQVVERGDDPKHVEYRKRKSAEKKAERQP